MFSCFHKYIRNDTSRTQSLLKTGSFFIYLIYCWLVVRHHSLLCPNILYSFQIGARSDLAGGCDPTLTAVMIGSRSNVSAGTTLEKQSQKKCGKTLGLKLALWSEQKRAAWSLEWRQSSVLLFKQEGDFHQSNWNCDICGKMSHLVLTIRCLLRHTLMGLNMFL